MSDNFTLDDFCDGNIKKDEVLGNLYREFYEEINYHKRAKILHSLVQTYLLHCKEQLEGSVKTEEFIEILSQIPHLCSKFLSTFEPHSSKEIASTENVGNKSENLQSASLCFDDVLACLEAFGIIKQCHVIVKISLNILFQGYTHCKLSEVIYGDLLEQFAEDLGRFYQKIESLQMIVLQQLDELNITKYHENDSHINSIVLEIGNLCQVVFSLDADIAFELWSKYIRIISHHTSLTQVPNINSVSTHLASKNIEILQLISYNQDKHSEEDEELSAKLFFYLDALSSMMNLVPDTFTENISEFRTFMLNLLECLVSSYSPFMLHKTSLNIIKNSLVKNMFALLSHLYANKEFLESTVILPDKHTHFSNLLLKLCALQFLKSASLEFKIDIFKDIFSDCLSGNAEDDMKLLSISIPKCTVTKAGDSDESITLYQFAYEQLTEFSKLLPNSTIEELVKKMKEILPSYTIQAESIFRNENLIKIEVLPYIGQKKKETTIFNYMMSSSDAVYLLISDTWMFRLRCTSIKFLEGQFNAILQYFPATPNKENNIKIQMFMKRILQFLPASNKVELLRDFNLINCIFGEKDVRHRFGVPHYTLTDDEICIYSEDEVKTRMCKLKGDCNNSLQLVEKVSAFLELCTIFLSVSDSSETLQFIEFACELFKTEVWDIQIAVLTFIRALSRKSLPEHNQEFGTIVAILAQLFSEAMHSKNYIIRYEARNIFNYFAKCTPHVKIIQETVRRDPSLKPIMKSYINALPPDTVFLSEKEKAEYLKKQMLRMDSIKFEIPQRIVKSLHHFFLKGNSEALT